MAAPNHRSNTSSSSSSPQPGAPGAPRFFLRPRTVDHYLHNFKIALEDFFNTQNPGQTEDYYLIGDFVVPRNKRKIVIYVAHEPLATARKVTRIYYTLPVNPLYAHIFDQEIEPGETLQSEGPLLTIFDVPAEYTASTFVDAIIADVATGPEEGRLASWASEILRMRTIGETAGEPFPRRRAANKVTHFWTPMRRSILDILRDVGINIPDEAGVMPAVWRSPAVSSSSARARAGAGAPAAPSRSSSGTRRRRSAERRRRATRRKTNSDPSRHTPTNIFNIDPVTGKRYRRRRPNSDPKDD